MLESGGEVGGLARVAGMSGLYGGINGADSDGGVNDGGWCGSCSVEGGGRKLHLEL